MADFSIAQAVTTGADAIYLSKRPLPIAPTGYYDWQITVDPSDDREGHSLVSNFVNRFEDLKAKGAFKPDPTVVGAFLDSVINPTSIDDRKGLFAAGLGITAKLDPYSDLWLKLNNQTVALLYNTIPHPPQNYLGPSHVFRQADGGGNNVDDPNLGRSGMPYSRSVQGRSGLPRASLPDPGLVFDTILRRRAFKRHAGGMSSLIFAYAAIVIHSLFRTDLKDRWKNNASSYLDLSPLYGDNQADLDKVRDKAKGRGLLYPDTFSENRLLFLPPATSVLLVIFSRNHNYVAEKILKINEQGKWSDPPPEDERLRAIQDEEIFQTARLINCGHFMSTITGDYAANFLGSSEGTNFNMNPFDEIKGKDLSVERGRGNHVSVEFNIMYRFHATVSEQDEKWTEDIFHSIFGDDKPFDQIGPQDLGKFVKAFLDIPADPSQRTFAGLTRGPDGRFSDDKLAEILHNAIEAPAGAFRGRGTPGCLRFVEILGIQESRSWGLCTLNEFRKYLGLKTYKTFEEWNPDPEIAAAARRLYGHIDNLEIYTGLQAEETMPVSDSLTLACGYTMTRGILGDAIALVRGDRFYSTDFTPHNLTTWGFYDCQRDFDNGCGGGCIPKLLLRHLPRHFPWNSAYSLFPFFTPDHMKDSLARRKIDQKYTFEHPKYAPIPKVLNTFAAIKPIFEDPSRFKVRYKQGGYGSILVFDDIAKHDNDKTMVLHALFPERESLNQHVKWVSNKYKQKLEEKTWTYDGVPGNYVDIIKDVIYPGSIHYAADKLLGIPLKTKSDPTGIFTENELFDMMTILFDNVFQFDKPETGFHVHDSAAEAAGNIVKLHVKALLEVYPALAPNYLVGLAARVGSLFTNPAKKEWYPFLSKLAATGRPLDQLVGNAVGLSLGGSAIPALQSAKMIDFYLDDARKKEREHIIELVKRNDAQGDALLRGYVLEGFRFRPAFPGVWREAAVDAQIDQGPGQIPLEVKAGDLIWSNFKAAHFNPTDFPDPNTINPARPLASYNVNGTGFHKCVGASYAQLADVELLKVVFGLKNVRRAPGDAGILKSITEVIRETETNSYLQRNGKLSSWPGSLVITWDS